MSEMETLPQRINVMKLVTYDVAHIVERLKEENGKDYEPDIGEVFALVEEFAKDDFSCGWGHEADVNELIYQDENGEEL